MAIARRCLMPVLCLLGAGAMAACDRQVDLGVKSQSSPGGAGDARVPGTDAKGAVLWSTSFEGGDASDWNQGGPSVGGTFTRMVTPVVVDTRAHRGTRSLEIAFDTSDGQQHMAEFYRRVEPNPAYYSAWFFINERHVPNRYWTVLYFFYQTQAGVPSTRHGLWDVNLTSQIAYFFDEPGEQQTNPSPRRTYPVGQWFHIEVYFSYEGRNGHITVWLDGEQIVDVPDLGAAVSDNLYWGVGSDTGGMDPTDCTMYVDDAAVSMTRLGPQFSL